MDNIGTTSFSTILIIASIVAASLETFANPTTAPSTNRIVLEKLDAIPESEIKYEVSVPPCARKRCPVQVRLLNKTQVHGTLELDWSVIPGKPTRGTIDESSGVGDPLQKTYEGTTWEFGEENNNVSIVVRTLALTSQLRGLLVHQRAGFEHVKRRHYLFVMHENRLERTWTGKEEGGPTWSTVVIHEADRNSNHQQNLIYFSGFLYPSNDQPDRLVVTIYSWNPERRKLEPLAPTNTAIKLYAVVAGTYQTASKARQLVTTYECLSSFEVLKSDLFSQVKPGQFVVARVGSSQPLAIELSEAIRSCDAALLPSVIETRIVKAVR